MGTELVWPSLCLAVALILLLAEAFVPSGGLIGVLAVGFLCVSLYLAFSTTPHGWLFVIVTGLLLPATVALAIQLWPRTPLAKYLFLKPPEQTDVIPEGHGRLLDHLVGQFARTLTPLRPTGTVDLEGRRLEGVSEEGMIPPNTMVRVVKVRGGRLFVRLADLPSIDAVAT